MKILKTLVVLFLVMGLSISGYSEPIKRTAEIVDLTGEVVVTTSLGETIPGFVGMTLNEGDIIATKQDSWAFLNVGGIEVSSIELNAESELLLSELVMDKDADTQQTLLDLSIGKILITASKIHSEESKFQVKTPTSVVGVRGATFRVEVESIE